MTLHVFRKHGYVAALHKAVPQSHLFLPVFAKIHKVAAICRLALRIPVENGGKSAGSVQAEHRRLFFESISSSQLSTQNLVGSTIECLPRSYFAAAI